jgi:hypothetical protein
LLAWTAVSKIASASCIVLIAARTRSGSTLARATCPITGREKPGRSGAGTRGCAGSVSEGAVGASIRSSSERRTRSLRCPARIALSRPRETHSLTVAGFTRSSSAISASMSHGSSRGVCAGRQVQAEADTASAATLTSDGRADPSEHAPAADQDRSAAGTGKRPRREYEASVGSPGDRQRDALIVSMLAYAGCARSRTAAAPGAICGTARSTSSRRRSGAARRRPGRTPCAGPRTVADGLWPSA